MDEMNGLARLRLTAGYTQRSFVTAFTREAERLGSDASISVRQLRRWERESPPPLPHPSQQCVLEAMFGIPLNEMGFVVPVHRLREGTQTGHAESVKRRTLALDAAALVAGATLTGQTGSSQPGTRIGAANLSRLRVQIDALYQTDHTQGSAPARVRARQIEGRITTALSHGSYTSATGHSLYSMLSELHSLQAWLGYDGGPTEQARTAALDALTSAQFTGDPLLHVSALETLILLSVKADRVWEAASAVDYAYRLARAANAGPAVRLVIALREANVAVHTNDLATARRALSRGVSHLGRLDTDTDVPPWAAFAGPGEVDYATASMYLRAGQPRRAALFLRSAVERLGAGYGRNSAWYRSKLADVLLQAGEVEEACAEMHAVLEAVGTVTSSRLAQRVQDFSQQAGRHDTAAARECVTRITDVMEASGKKRSTPA